MEAHSRETASTVVLVTPCYDATDPAWGFVARHIDALVEVCGWTIVIVTGGTAHVDRLAVEVVQAGHRGGVRDAVTAVVARTDDPVVVILDDLSVLEQTRHWVGDEVRILWWSSRVPSQNVVAAAGRTADGVLVAEIPPGGTVGVPSWRVGAGVDLRPPPAFPESPPLHLVALGRTSPRKGLAVMIRAVAIARSNGVDSRLAIVGPSTNALERKHRLELEALIKNVALTAVARIDQPVTPPTSRAILSGAHALIDASDDDDLHLASLEAIATGRPVLTSNEYLLRHLDLGDDGRLLYFEPGNASQLAQRIGMLAEVWPNRFSAMAESVRDSIAAAHGASVLVTQWATAVAEVTSRAGERSATRAIATTSSTDPASIDAASEPVAVVQGFLDTWSDKDAKGGIACFEPGALRFDAASPIGDVGTPATEYLTWVADTAADLATHVEELIAVEHGVVAVRHDQWTLADEQFEVRTHSLFEVARGLITSWTDLELVTSGYPSRPDLEARSNGALDTLASELGQPVDAEVLTNTPWNSIHSLAPTASGPLNAADTNEVAPVTQEQISRYETQVHHWRQQAVIWRERALTANDLAEAYRSSVDDLRRLVDLLEEQRHRTEGPGRHSARELELEHTPPEEPPRPEAAPRPDDVGGGDAVDPGPSATPITSVNPTTPRTVPAAGSATTNAAEAAPSGRSERRDGTSTRLARFLDRVLGKDHLP